MLLICRIESSVVVSVVNSTLSLRKQYLESMLDFPQEVNPR